jgi:RNA 2',3'-cyclic 3'-phosphodiesterase
MRSFLAIELPEETKDRVLELSKKFDFTGVTLVKRNALHITLLFFEDANDNEIGEIKAAMDSIRSDAFAILLRGVSSFDKERPKVVFIEVAEGADKLKLIHEELSKHLPSEEREFTPHLTIARVRDQRSKDRIIAAINELNGAEMGRFTVSGIKLIKSTLTSEGPVYETLYEVKF